MPVSTNIPDRPNNRKAVALRLGADVVREVVVDVMASGVKWVGLAGLAGLGVLIWRGGDVPAWTLAAVLLLAVIGGGVVWRYITRLRTALDKSNKRIAKLETRAKKSKELKDERDILRNVLARYDVYSQHVEEVLDQLQRVVVGDLGVSLMEYVQRGILDPARDALVEWSADRVRLSILVPDEDHFVMALASGHSLPGMQNYRQPIKDTLSCVAYEAGEPRSWDDVAEDPRFKPNPLATYPTRSMISLPLRYGDDVIGVLNAISPEPYDFDPAEEQYLASLAPIISVALGFHQERKRSS